MIAEVPRQRGPVEENKQVKEGKVPEEWKTRPRKLAQKDLNARWMVKRGRSHYGYKNSIAGGNTDAFIHGYVVSPANAHDSKIVPACYFEPAGENSANHGDSAYCNKTIAGRLEQAAIATGCSTWFTT